MIWEMLLSASIETTLGLLTEAGLEKFVRPLYERLAGSEQKARTAALHDALQKAIKLARCPEIETILAHQGFQEEVIQSLLDPQHPFDVQEQAAFWSKQFPDIAPSLNRFFNALQYNLLTDPIWGDILDRYQTLRFREDVRQALQARQLPTQDAPIIHAISAKLHGGGAISQGDHNKTVGQNGTLVEGSIGQLVQITINQFIQQGAAPASAGSFQQDYLNWTATQANLLPWAKINTEFASPERGESFTLADIYVALDVFEVNNPRSEYDLRRQDASDRRAALQIANEQQRLLLMGDPGSGKSTFVKHLTYLMAQAMLAKDPQPWLKRLPDWKHAALLPVRIELRQIVTQIQPGEKSSAALILRYLRHELAGYGLENYADELNAAIQSKEKPILFLLDGLDEVPTAQRQLVVDAVNDLHKTYPQHRYIVTCRPYAYVGQPWQLHQFHTVSLAVFNEQQIEQFVQNWYDRLTERERIEARLATQKAQSLKQAVRRPDLRVLAERPLLLTVMAQLHAYTGQLPDDRTQLYADTVQLLLQRWESRLGETRGLLETLAIPLLKMSDLESGLYEVAYRAHSAQPVNLRESADITEGQLREWLARYLNHDWNKAGEFVAYIRERAGLLIRHKTEAYTFPHRSFQEFLAACHWLSLPDYPAESARMVTQDWDRWREVFVLASGYAARSKRLGQAIAAVNALLPENPKPYQQVQAGEIPKITLVVESLQEIGLLGVQREPAGRAILERTQQWLIAALQSDESLNPKQRAEVGNVLAELGDPRFDAEHWHLPKEPGLGFVHIPEGAFVMGSDPQVDSQAYHDEQPQHQVTLPEYWLARYPVTVAQYRAFVESSGYKTSDADSLRGVANHPVVYVYWRDALAYSRWLDGQLKNWVRSLGSSDKLPMENGLRALVEGLQCGKLSVQLPSEAEWEKAARGGISPNPSPPGRGEGVRVGQGVRENARIYPWGNDPNPNFANYGDTGIGATSTVGAFAGGVSPYSVQDLSGNVWEWTRTIWAEKFSYPYNGDDGREWVEDQELARVVRGGSFNDVNRGVRCAVRFRLFFNNGYFGFRVVVLRSTPEA